MLNYSNENSNDDANQFDNNYATNTASSDDNSIAINNSDSYVGSDILPIDKLANIDINYNNNYQVIYTLEETSVNDKLITNIPDNLQKKDLINLLLKFFCSWKIKKYSSKRSHSISFYDGDDSYDLDKSRLKKLDIVTILLIPITVATVIFFIPKNNNLYYLPVPIILISQRYLQTKKTRRKRGKWMNALLLSCFILSFSSLITCYLYPYDINKIGLIPRLNQDHSPNSYQRVANLWTIVNVMLLVHIWVTINQHLCISPKIQTFKPLSTCRTLWAVLLAILLYIGCIYFCSHYWYQAPDTHCGIIDKNMLVKTLNILNYLDFIPQSQGFDEFIFIMSLLIPKLAKLMISLDATICQLFYNDPRNLETNQYKIRYGGSTSLKIAFVSVLLIFPGYLVMKVLSNCTPLSTLFLSAVIGWYIEPIIKFSLQLLLNPDRKIFRKDSIDRIQFIHQTGYSLYSPSNKDHPFGNISFDSTITKSKQSYNHKTYPADQSHVSEIYRHHRISLSSKQCSTSCLDYFCNLFCRKSKPSDDNLIGLDIDSIDKNYQHNSDYFQDSNLPNSPTKSNRSS